MNTKILLAVACIIGLFLLSAATRSDAADFYRAKPSASSSVRRPAAATMFTPAPLPGISASTFPETRRWS